MKIFDISRRSARNLRQAKARTLLTALAIGVGAFALTMTLAASNGAQAYVNRLINSNFDPTELLVAKDETIFGRGDNSQPQEYDPSFGSVSSASGAPIQVKQVTEEEVNKILKYDLVEQVREGIILNVQYVTRPGQKKYIANIQDFNPARNPEALSGSIPRPLNDTAVLLPEAYLSKLGFKDAQSAIGKEVTVAIRKSLSSQILESGVAPRTLKEAETIADKSTVLVPFKIAAVLKPEPAQPGTELSLQISTQAAKNLNDIATAGTSQYRQYTTINVKVKDGQDKAKLQQVQDQLKKDGFSSQSVEETQQFLTQIINVLKAIVAAFGLIAIIASVFGVVNTMYISVLQRTREIGLMKALGMRRRDVSRLFRFEAAWIGFLGGALGSGFAFILGTLLNPWITKKLDFGTQKLLIFKANQIAILIFLLVLVAIFAGLLPARKASKLDPIEALRTE